MLDQPQRELWRIRKAVHVDLCDMNGSMSRPGKKAGGTHGMRPGYLCLEDPLCIGLRFARMDRKRLAEPDSMLELAREDGTLDVPG